MYDFGIRNALTGYRVAYRLHEANHCPGCGKSQWIIGRVTAECAFCGTALPLVGGANFSSGLVRRPKTLAA
jgi:hypothetical protein